MAGYDGHNDKTHLPNLEDVGGVKVIDEDRLLQTGSVFKDDSTLDHIFRGNGFSLFNTALSSSLYGLDISGLPSPAPMQNDQNGLTFFTRPLLNLSYYNLKADRTLAIMDTNVDKSVARYVKAMLDPINNGTYGCSLVDPKNPFIPILSNTLSTLSGWRDPIVDTYQSPAGIKKQQWGMTDSSNKVWGSYELSASFRNIRGSFLTYLFHVWQTYQSLVYEGIVDPWPQMIRYNAIDYQTRIWRLMLDPTRQYVEEVTSCSASWPLTNPLGVRANKNDDSPVNRELDVLNHTFSTMGAHYFDPLHVDEFNNSIKIFNRDFESVTAMNKAYRKLYPNEYKLFSYRAIPRINPLDSKMEWWVSREVHRAMLGEVSYPSNPY